MTQFEAPDQTMQPRKTSGLAITALICSITCVCAPIGALLGLIAFATIGEKKGKGLAVAAILIGVVLSVVSWMGYTGFVKPNIIDPMVKAVTLVTSGPTDAMSAGFAGDAAAFKAEFTGAAATASGEQVTDFIETLRGRYGEYVSMEPAQNQQQPGFGAQEAPFQYLVTFDTGTVDAEAMIVFADNSGPIMKFRSITIFDPDEGDVAFPPAP
ncbi:MAG: DUF4190 domain-containing protein [Planctomycetes bacterium]|nr:DUF4190 domain-containing protein [Planctomycetota bacterium]